jgi:solute carrier family 13 (sodium-dependent dicarboxylate transporter), member 2/3/5
MPADSRAPAEKPAILEPLPPWSRGELVCAISFGLAVIGWTAPGIAQALSLPFADTLEDKLEPGIVAIFAASILFAASDGRGTRVLSWREAVGIDWGTIILFGGGLALGAQLVDTGLAASISRGFIAVTGIRDLWLLTGACCLFTIFFSEICSNTAAANMLVPLVIAIAVELHQPIAPPALAVGIGASCGFMLPIATGPNAIVYSTGRVTQWQMIRVGIVFDVVCALLIFGILRVLCPLFGWA